MDSYKLAEIQPDSTYSGDLIIDKSFILCPASCPVTQEMLRALADWNFDHVIQNGTETIAAFTAAQPTESQGAAAKTQGTAATAKTSAKASINKAAPQDIVEKENATQETASNPAIREALNHAKEKDASNDKSRMEIVQDIYNEYLNYITNVYTHYATHKEFNRNEINETVKELVEFIKENRRYVLRITPSIEDRTKKFLIIHSMRSTVLAITIALQLKLPMTKLVEIGVACLLHEIGMLRLSPQLYMNNKPLTLAEKTQILKHPVLSYNILKDAKFPTTLTLGVLDHHERANGTGYPRHLTGNQISLYGKIIAVACSFEAITAPRHFKEARTTYDAMVEMLKNANHQYDDTVVKALLYSLSLYPIGAYVYLINGKAAQVIDVSPNDPLNPIVQIIGEKTENGSPRTVQTNQTDAKIMRALSREETEDVVKTIQTEEQVQKSPS